MFKYFHDVEKVKKVAVNLEGDTQRYALSFLHIWNNAREYPGMIMKVENSPSNMVYLTCKEENLDAVKDYVSQFGEVKYVEDVNLYVIKADYDMAGWEKIWGGDSPKDVDFMVDIE